MWETLDYCHVIFFWGGQSLFLPFLKKQGSSLFLLPPSLGGGEGGARGGECSWPEYLLMIYIVMEVELCIFTLMVTLSQNLMFSYFYFLVSTKIWDFQANFCLYQENNLNQITFQIYDSENLIIFLKSAYWTSNSFRKLRY